jgi:hypothetical protein
MRTHTTRAAVALLAAGALFGWLSIPTVGQQKEPGTGAKAEAPLTPAQLAERTLHRRAVDAVIWGQPIVSFDAMRQAYLRDGKAKYNDIIRWPKRSGWKNQSLTVNTSVRYIYFFFNSKEDGPVVLELPAGVDGASFFGTITDAWFLPPRPADRSRRAGRAPGSAARGCGRPTRP